MAGSLLRAALAGILLLLAACAPPGPRPAYSRETGDWVAPEDAGYSWTPPADLDTPRGTASDLRRAAEAYLGVPYSFGSQSRRGMDCSGFVRQVFSDAGKIQLPHSSAAMARYGKQIDKEDLQPGDLVFFKRVFGIDHVGIYMGDGFFIHSQSGVGVTYTKLEAAYFASHYAGAKRILN